MLYPNAYVISKYWGGSGGGCSTLGSWCKGDGRGTPVPPARQLGSVSPDPPGPTAPREVCSCSLSPVTPKDPQAGSTRWAVTVTLLFSAYNLFSATH